MVYTFNKLLLAFKYSYLIKNLMTWKYAHDVNLKSKVKNCM